MDAGKIDAARERIVSRLRELVPKLKTTSADASRTNQFYQRNDAQREADEHLTDLCGFFWETGRLKEVKVLLDESPWWSGVDLGKLQNSVSDFRDRDLKLLAAQSLASLGEKDMAVRILENSLAKSASDKGYALLIQLQGTAAIPFLDRLFHDDPFEERPLIWKSGLLLTQNDLDAAENAIRQAIAIDPSDGEMGKGDRMRAYAVLADILEKRGDSNQAATFRGAVRAIRLSEDADDFMRAGLLSRAVKMYEEALTFFSDAYCIQSRIAIQLTKLGRTNEAAVHYQRAYELMPDSFGRIESHCFGCERAFEGKTAETLAERTFNSILEKTPNKPQAHYLLGYLRMEQQRYVEAAASFRKAVELDPDYFNAWSKLVGIAAEAGLDSRERDRAIFELYRLDPLGRHRSVQVDDVSDLRGLWAAADLASKRQVFEPPVEIYPLPASKASSVLPDDDYRVYSRKSDDRSPIKPGELLATNHSLIRQLGTYIAFDPH